MAHTYGIVRFEGPGYHTGISLALAEKDLVNPYMSILA